MAVVSDTSPLRYLIAAGQADLIAKLFGTVHIPRAVEGEILDPHSPLAVRQWMSKRPAWLQVRGIQRPLDPDLARQLHAGEAEAIQLALELRAKALLMDERRGRQVAGGRDITVIGALGILRESYRIGLISNPIQVAAQLRSSGFRASRRLIRRFEEQLRELNPELSTEETH